ncbi:uncharacterized protein LOC134435248 [Engraulis encrasicolus]|uniref:uncharacterized protein LOC134435248 n=1 Tax=Engraulis encrasicolus TaxID=184585 RepID=UPI002FD6E839
MQFQDYSDVEQYLRFGRHREDQKEPVRIRKLSKRFFWKEGCLWHYNGLKHRRVLRSVEEVQSVLKQLHDDNNHINSRPLLSRLRKGHHWKSMRKDVEDWINKCPICIKKRRAAWISALSKPYCLCYGCDSTSQDESLTFHKFPIYHMDRLHVWVTYAKRDLWSVTQQSFLCSKHFTEDCFDRSEGKVSLQPDAVPTVPMASNSQQEVEVEEEEDDGLPPNPEEEHIEHPYAGNPERREKEAGGDPVWENRSQRRKESTFSRYDAVEKFLTTHTYPKEATKTLKMTIRRLTKKFFLEDGVLFYRYGDRQRRVLRSRTQVNEVLRQFHDNSGHYGVKHTTGKIAFHFFWGTMMKDVRMWVGNCKRCLARDDSRRNFHCSVNGCNNFNGPVERSLGLSFHRVYKLAAVDYMMRNKANCVEEPGAAVKLLDQQSHDHRNQKNRRKVLRTREEVHATLSEYHNNMNHLEANKCIKLISKHFYWGSLKADVRWWVEKCEVCSPTRNPPTRNPPDPQPEESFANLASPEGSDHEPLSPIPALSPSSSQVLNPTVTTKPAMVVLRLAPVKVLLGVKLFRVKEGEPTSVLDLPGNVIIVPQESLSGTLKNGQFEYSEKIDASKGIRLYRNFVTQCEKAVASSKKSMEAKCVVQCGVYGQKQNMYLNAEDPLTHVIKF